MSRDEFDDDRPRRRSRWDDDPDDHSRPRRRPIDDYDPEADFDDRPRRRRKADSGPLIHVLGGVSLASGLLALLLSVACGGIGIVLAAIGLGVGIIGVLIAHQGRRRSSPVLPILGTALNLIAMAVAVVFIVTFVRDMQQAEREFQAEMEQAERDEAVREQERIKAPADVRAAADGGAVPVTARQFYKLWEDDEDAFDTRYKNKVVEVTGKVDEIDFTGDEYMVLMKAGQEGDTVDCLFAKSPEVRARLADLKPGDTVTIRGKCLGEGPILEACVLFGGRVAPKD